MAGIEFTQQNLVKGFGHQGRIGYVVLGTVGMIARPCEQAHLLELLHKQPALGLAQVPAGNSVERVDRASHGALALRLVIVLAALVQQGSRAA